MASSPLRRIAVLTERLDQLNAERDLAVSRAVAAGATWAEIGEALGCTAQGAHKRYRWVRHNARTGEVWHEPPLPHLTSTIAVDSSHETWLDTRGPGPEDHPCNGT